MESAIENIFNGKCGRKGSFPISEKYRERQKEEVELEKAFLEKIEKVPEAVALYWTLEEAESRVASEEALDSYKEAFRFGFLLAIDVFGLA